MGLCASTQAVESAKSQPPANNKPSAQPKSSQPAPNSTARNNNNANSLPVVPPSSGSPYPATRDPSGSISITAPISTTPRRKAQPSTNAASRQPSASPSTASPVASRSPSAEVVDPMSSKLSSSDSTKNLLAINSKIADAAKFENVLLSLKQIPILSRLTDDERLKLAVHLKEKSYPDTTKIVTEGDVGHEFFIIKEGECVVTKFSAESKETIRLATLKKGDYFGEKALINNEPRAASVVAHGPCICFYMDRTAFHELFGNHLNVQFAKRHAISAEVGTSFHKAYIAPQNVNRVKDGQIRGLIHNALQKNVILCALDRDQHDQVCEEMWQKKIDKGVSIINQGEDGDNFYVIESGEFEVFVTRDGKKPKKVAILRAGQSFGELALMYNAPRAATVTAAAAAVVWAVDRYAFRRIVAKVSQHKLDEYNHFLQNVPVLAPLASYERAKIAEALEEIYFNAGDIIIKQGDEGDAFYILKSGEVLCTRREDTAPDVSVEVKRYYPGEYFGERALLKKEPRAATLTAVTACTCLCLDRQAFTLLLGPLEDIMQKRLAQYSSSSKSLLSREESVEFQPKEKTVTIELKDLVVVGTLGKGSFGHVQLVKHKATNETYALKTVSKFQVVQLGQQEHLINESHVMAVLNHPNLIRLHARFQDKNCLYFVMELCLGGELFTVLRERTLFDEKTAKFYAASVVLAFEYMHSKDIVYRDLKPENLLLDKQGYLKITDFGFAKVCKNRTWTLCGTPDYLAPEVVSGAGHGKPVDWWTLGIFIFEMLASYPPFYDEDPVKTYAKIMQGDITFPRHFTPDAVSLVAGLLHPKSTRRLGSGKGGAKQIKEHPWFAKFDWDALINRTMPAPIIPRIKHELDLSNFEKYPDSGEKIQEFDDSQQFLFKDF